MPKALRPAFAAHGFSMVEMLVALVFTGLLMAGMSQVFKSSLSSFYTSGEALSSVRRNRMSVDILYDDLNAAGMYLTSLTAPPSNVSPGNPAFYILPNMPIDGGGKGDLADELYFYMDQPLGFEGTLSAAGRSAAAVIAAGGVIDAKGGDSQFVIDCGDPSYAKQVKAGHYFITKDSWETLYVQSVAASGQVATVTAGGSPSAGVTGMGSIGTPSRFQHIAGADGTRVLFYAPAQMVRYSIKMKALDPQNAAGVPCLVRDQGNYSSGVFLADTALESIITENIALPVDYAAEKGTPAPSGWAGFKVYLSVDAGNTWAGEGQKWTGFAEGWDSGKDGTTGIRNALDKQLHDNQGKLSRLDYDSTRYTAATGNDHWFRKIPTLVRLDITTRTGTQRTEYSPKPIKVNPSDPDPTATFRTLTQSLVVVPRHFGLPIN